METFFLTVAVVSLAEMGDRSQLLALVLAVRYRQPVPILLGLALAASVIHGISTVLGATAGQLLEGAWLNWIVGLLFIGMGVWVLFEGGRDDEVKTRGPAGSVFATAFFTFLLMEIGDKTQLASMALAARFEMVLPVLLGATLAMVLINVPVIWLGDRFAARVPMKLMHGLAASLFIVIGLWTLWEAL